MIAIDANNLLGTHDILFITIDALRYDVAAEAWEDSRIPNLAKLLPSDGWELRHTPGNFTYSAHQAFFAGFLPTPAKPGRHTRLFALEFAGSETTAEQTCVLSTHSIVTGLADRGYATICIGGVGFFNKENQLGRVLPDLFQESHWHPQFGVTDPDSTENQVQAAVNLLHRLPDVQRCFLFLNVSATHQPNCCYVAGATEDSPATQLAALAYVDQQLPILFSTMQRRAPVLCIICSDHGTAYGEDGFVGHRLSHPTVWNVPYMECVLPQIREIS